MFNSKFEELCYQAYNDRLLIDNLNWITYSTIKFRYAFSQMSKEIEFRDVNDVVKTNHGFIGKDTSHIMPVMLDRTPKFHLYLPKDYTDELREENIKICLDANLKAIKDTTSNRYWLYYIDAIQDLLYSPSSSYKKLMENWALQLMDLARPGSLAYIRLKDDVLPLTRREDSFPRLYMASTRPTDFINNSYML